MHQNYHGYVVMVNAKACATYSDLRYVPTVELIALDSFYWCSQYHKHSYIGLEGEAGVSHEVVGKGYVNIENSQMVSIGAIFSSKYHTKQLNLWPTHQLVVW